MPDGCWRCWRRRGESPLRRTLTCAAEAPAGRTSAFAWDWLTAHEPESYDQLYQKLADARETVSQSGQSELGSLIRVFRGCEKHGISLTKLDTPAHMSKYREAASYLRGIIEEDNAKAELLKAIERIQSDRTRRETRQWVR